MSQTRKNDIYTLGNNKNAAKLTDMNTKLIKTISRLNFIPTTAGAELDAVAQC